jgi:hypothetical protein
MKGTHVIATKKWIDRKLGPDAYLSILSAVKAPDKWRITLPSSTYEVDALYRIFEAAAKLANCSIEAMSYQVCEEHAAADLNSVYRAFMRVAGLTNVLRAVPRIWRQYANFGVATIVRNDPGHFVFRASSYPPEVIAWMRGGWRSYPSTALVMAGGRNPSSEAVTDPNDREYEVSIRYTP